MFLLPDNGNWLDPRNGKHVDMSGWKVNPKREMIKITEEGLQKHPLPRAVDIYKGAKRGQLTGDDYRQLIDNGVSGEEIFNMNGKFLMEELAPKPKQ